MSTQNNFLPFAAGGAANVLSQAGWEALAAGVVANGFASGTAVSQQLNKVWRQSSIMAAVTAGFINAQTGVNSVDDGTTATLLSNLHAAIAKNGYVADSGAVNAYVMTLAPAMLAYYDGMVVGFKTANANTVTNPTVNVNGLGAVSITLPGGGALAAGQIVANVPTYLVYNATGPRFELLGSSSSSVAQIQTVTATVAANALTLGLAATKLDFRNNSLTSGAVTTLSSGALSLVVPSTATLGTVAATQSRLVLLAINNAGTVELAVVNLAGGNDLTETGVISTTAISAAATANNVVYSTTARTNVAYRVVGYVESTQATAGTWATAPSTVQGYGGQALAAMSSLGYGQALTKPGKTVSTTYYNTSGKPRFVTVCGNNGSTSCTGLVSINGATPVEFARCDLPSGTATAGGGFLVQLNESYAVTGITVVSFWTERG